ncbi:hypothetical protein QTL97_16935 [Sporosarcina thermotolerans]|uniref:Uncharacterized protein n=1 Tax=Sporosarcina thermotolerans TaxID=633404 RepID=A0AAW9ADE5_9BACL|nr:hypothetical protein [Sporosarcina thermotolerans]MDW0118613.1 hypothetical protein [Sporosarcina thermotolerans]WHT49593.1 hypothetical protein QNH10_08855 [Sporosarcina thermotolerans]
MGIIEWETVLTDVLSGSAVLIIGAVGGGLFGYFRGKKKSVLAIERKNMIYQPLLDELNPISNFELNVFKNEEASILKEVVTNEYKYGLSTELQEKCNQLYSLIQQFNKINLVSVAQNKIVGIFESGYREIFGSIIDGISNNKDRDGNEWEVEHLALPVELIRRTDFKKSIINLLNNEELYDSEVCVDENNNIFVPIYGELVHVYNSVLHATINGVSNQLPPLKKELGMSPAEYMALNYDFFKIFNADTQKIRKYELREEIIFKSQEVIEDLKEVIRKIVQIYEVEEV